MSAAASRNVGRGLVPRRISIDDALCVGCAYCKLSCPAGAMEVEDALARVVEDACTGCATCAAMCPVEAISAIPAEEA